MPTFSSAAWRLMVRPPTWRTSPKGTTAKVTSTGTRLSTGARKWRTRSVPAGTTSSLSRNLIGSATSVFTSPRPAKPRMAARLAPMRSWMSALTFRSKKTPRPITWTIRSTMKSALAAVMATSATALLAGQALDQGERARDVQVLVVLLVVHLEAGGGPAGGQALDLLEREPPVGRPLAVADAEARLERAQDVPGAAQRAGEVAAHLDVPAPLRLLPVHGVEGGDRGHPGERQLHQLRHVLHGRQREPAELVLREPEGRHEGRAPRRVAVEDRVVLGERSLREAGASGVSGHTRPRSC